MVTSVFVCLGFKLGVERKDVIHEMKLEFLDIFPIAFTFQEFLPRFKEIFQGDDIIISMTEPFKSPPPSGFCQVFWKRLRVRILFGMDTIIHCLKPNAIL